MAKVSRFLRKIVVCKTDGWIIGAEAGTGDAGRAGSMPGWSAAGLRPLRIDKKNLSMPRAS